MSVWPYKLNVPLRVVLDRYARHSEGAVLVFGDGHVKWYRGDQIKDRYFGGPIRTLWTSW